MSEWQKSLRRILVGIENQIDRLSQWASRRIDKDPIQIVPYVGYGNNEIIAIRGRVLEDNGIRPPEEADTSWENLLNSYRRFATDEIPEAVVKAKLGTLESMATADDEGYFRVQMMHEGRFLKKSELSHDVLLELVSAPGWEPTTPITATANVILPGPNAEYGVISDLDDTVLQSSVLSYLDLVKNTFLENAHTRLPFAGVSAFYRALQNGAGGHAFNPMHYVSSSPWNLYDFLIDFLRLRQIPKGPLFLQDIGLTDNQWVTADHGDHKIAAINEIFQIHAHLPFVLIGDSTQHDAFIYAEIARKQPERVHVIYIRDVDTEPQRQQEIEHLSAELAGYSVPMLLVKDTVAAASDAVARGLIEPDTLSDVRESEAEPEVLSLPDDEQGTDLPDIPV